MANDDSSETRDMLYVVGGLALLVLGAGLIASHPLIRRSVRSGLESIIPDLRGSVGSHLAEVVPDVQRYIKLRAM